MAEDLTGVVADLYARIAALQATITSLQTTVNALTTVFGVKLRRVANQQINNVTAALITFDTEDYDPNGFIAVSATTLTVPAGGAGFYIYSFRTQVGSLAASNQPGNLMVNGTAYTSANSKVSNTNNTTAASISRHGGAAGASTGDTAGTLWLEVGDTIALQVSNLSGFPLQYTVPFFYLARLMT